MSYAVTETCRGMFTDDAAAEKGQKNKHVSPRMSTSKAGKRQRRDLCINHREASQINHPNTRKTVFFGPLKDTSVPDLTNFDLQKPEKLI